MIKRFKKESKVLRKKFTTRVLIIASTAIALAVSGTVLMADWTGNTTAIYTMGPVGIGTDNPQDLLEIRDGQLSVLKNDAGIDRGVILTTSMSKNQGLIITPNIETGLAFRIGAESTGQVMRFTPNGIIGKFDIDVNGKIILKYNPENYIDLIDQSRINQTVTNVTEIVGRQLDLYAYDDIVLRAGTGHSNQIHFIQGTLQLSIIGILTPQ